MSTPPVSVIVAEPRSPQRIARSLRSLRRQTVPAEVVGVVTRGLRAAVLEHAPEAVAARLTAATANSPLVAM